MATAWQHLQQSPWPVRFVRDIGQMHLNITASAYPVSFEQKHDPQERKPVKNARDRDANPLDIASIPRLALLLVYQ
jgi:hypothetical protein